MHGLFLIDDALGALLGCGDLPEAAGKDEIDQFKCSKGADGVKQQIGEVMLCDADAEIISREGVFFEGDRHRGAVADEVGDDVSHFAVKVEIRRQKEERHHHGDDILFAHAAADKGDKPRDEAGKCLDHQGQQQGAYYKVDNAQGRGSQRPVIDHPGGRHDQQDITDIQRKEQQHTAAQNELGLDGQGKQQLVILGIKKLRLCGKDIADKG